MISRNALKLMKEELSNSQLLKDKMGSSIESLITFKPTINATELNQISGAKFFITLSINRVSNHGTANQTALKVGLALPTKSSEDDILDMFPMTREIKNIISTTELIYDSPEQYQFIEMDEAYFDNDQNLWGYVMMFVSKDAK